MSDPTLTVDPDGTVHASLEVDLPAEEPEQPEPATNDATDALGNVIVGTAKAAGKVLKTVWDVLKPEGSQEPSSE